MRKNKKIIWFLLFFLLFLLGVNFILAKVELKYPEIPGAEAPTKPLLPNYIKYIFNFLVIISGLVGFGVLVFGGIKYSLSAGNPVLIAAAKNQILGGFLGIIIVLSSYFILTTINPQLAIIKFPGLEVVEPFPSPGIPSPEIPELEAFEIPLGKLMDGYKIKVEKFTSEATYGESGIKESDLTEVSTIAEGVKDDYGKSWEEFEPKMKAKLKEIEEAENDVIRAIKNAELEKMIKDFQTTVENKIGGGVTSLEQKLKEIEKKLDKPREYTGKKETKITNFIYEGVFAETRLERVEDILAKVKFTSDQIKYVSMAMNATAGVLTALTATCNCALCACLCGPCAGDPCWPVRKAIIASQAALTSGALSLPPLAALLDIESKKLGEEKEKLKKDFEVLTQGLKKGEKEFKICEGFKDGKYLTLMFYFDFWGYKEALEREKLAKIEVTKPWPEIDPEDDPLTLYCTEILEKPAELEIEIKEPAIKAPEEKMPCGEELKIGELLEKIKSLIEGKEQIFDQTEKTIKEAKKIIQNAAKMASQEKFEDIPGEILKEGIPEEFQESVVGKSIKQFLSGEDLREITSTTLNNLAQSQIKEIYQDILKELPGGMAKEITLDILGRMKDEDLKEIVWDHLSSLKNKELKRLTNEIIEALPENQVRELAKIALNSMTDKDAKNFWTENFKKMGEEGRKEVFNTILRGSPPEKMNENFKEIAKNSSAKDNKKIIKEIWQALPSGQQKIILEKILKEYPGETFEEKFDNLSEEDTKKVSQEILDYLHQRGILVNTLRNLSDRAKKEIFTFIPVEKFKSIMNEGIYNSVSYDYQKELQNKILKYSPGYLRDIVKYLPANSNKDFLLNQIIEQIPDTEVGDILGDILGSYPDSEKYLNTILEYIPSDKIQGVAEEVSSFLAHDFTKEAVEAGKESKTTSDMISNVSRYLKVEEIKKIIKEIIKIVRWPGEEIKKVLQDFSDEFSEIKNIEFLKSVLGKIPGSNLVKANEKVLSQIPPEKLIDAIDEMIEFIPKEKLGEVITNLLKYLPEEEWQIVSAKTLIENKLERATSEDLPDLLKETVDYIPKEKLSQTSKDILKYVPIINTNKVLEISFEYLPDDLVSEKMKEVLEFTPSDKMEELFYVVLEKIPKGIKEFDNEVLKSSDKDLKSIFDKLFEKIPTEKIGEYFNKVINWLSNEIKEKVIKKIISKIPQTDKKKIVEDIKKEFPEVVNLIEKIPGLETVLEATMLNIPGLKQNSLHMAKLPLGCNSFLCGCSCPLVLVCQGKTPACPFEDIVKTFKYITINNAKINLSHLNLFGAANKIINDLFKKEVKGASPGVIPDLNEIRKELTECRTTPEDWAKFFKGEKGLEKALYRCEDLQRLGIIEECYPYSFFCCYSD